MLLQIFFFLFITKIQSGFCLNLPKELTTFLPVILSVKPFSKESINPTNFKFLFGIFKTQGIDKKE